ncbi:MAG TPA: peptidylprolyl isomerase [Pirellulales bacterium]|nr:peptidylprolyl isomerase [Pirellulales bacterium]
MIRLGLIVVVSFFAVSPLLAQKASAPKATPPKSKALKANSAEDKPAKTDAPKAEASDDPEAAATQYDEAMAQWKELLAKLRDLRTEWASTRPKERAPLEKQYQELVAEAEAFETKMIAAAEAAVATESSKKSEAGKFLAEQLKYDADRDDYEAALPIARVLIEHDYENPRIYNYGGLAAACTNDFDLAEQWLKEGDRHSVLDVEAKQILTHIDEYKELWQKEQELREAEAKSDDLPRVLVKTNKGDLVVELFENEAPNTVANFLTLVEKGFFDGTDFHRVIPHFMAQGGDPQNDGRGGPGYKIPDEQKLPAHRNHFRGSLSMANTGQPNSGGSQFFLMFRPVLHLNGRHAVFGRVIDGLDVLAKIQRNHAMNAQGQDEPTGEKPDKLVSAKVLRKRPHEYQVKKIGAADDDAKGEAKDETNK